jgi:hypothetical protein
VASIARCARIIRRSTERPCDGYLLHLKSYRRSIEAVAQAFVVQFVAIPVTDKALGLSFPTALLVRADEVIE